MDTQSMLIGLDIGLVLALLYVIDRNLFDYVYLQIQNLFVTIQLQVYQRAFRIRLWYDKQSLRPGPVGRFLREQQLRGIRNNPAYREFFRDKV